MALCIYTGPERGYQPVGGPMAPAPVPGKSWNFGLDNRPDPRDWMEKLLVRYDRIVEADRAANPARNW